MGKVARPPLADGQRSTDPNLLNPSTLPCRNRQQPRSRPNTERFGESWRSPFAFPL